MHRSRISCTPAVNIKMLGTAFFADLRPGRSTALGLQRERAESVNSLHSRKHFLPAVKPDLHRSVGKIFPPIKLKLLAPKI